MNVTPYSYNFEPAGTYWNPHFPHFPSLGLIFKSYINLKDLGVTAILGRFTSVFALFPGLLEIKKPAKAVPYKNIISEKWLIYKGLMPFYPFTKPKKTFLGLIMG